MFNFSNIAYHLISNDIFIYISGNAKEPYQVTIQLHNYNSPRQSLYNR